MTNRRPIGVKVPTTDTGGEDDFTRLVRVIARQAAKEGFNVFRDGLETRSIQVGPPCNPPELKIRAENTATKTRRSPEPGERFLSVAEVAMRLGVSGKTVRRMIQRGDLRAHRIGRLVRVSESSIADTFGKTKVIVRSLSTSLV
jgi:excisionase family DNA binding protein